MTSKFFLEKSNIIVIATIKGLTIEFDFKFILDTGASISILDESVAKQLGFVAKDMKMGDRLTTVGGGKQSKLLKLPKFSLFGKEILDYEMNVVSLPSQILFLADGLIGMDFLLRFPQVKIDFVNKTIET
ncbi:MAG: retropepsin-like domain-containing protein [Tannerella sp.]|jgi:predicted aspartyl protease|nr:retropepsin-like domain-containing protein [Tannerella sp.]